MAGKPRPAETLKQLFWSKVTTSDPQACWLWNGAVGANGYGHLQQNNKTVSAHRAAWEYTHGDIPDGLFVLHRCDTPRCCNPGHLFLGTNRDNVDDMMAKGRSRFPVNPDRRPRGPRRADGRRSDAKLTESIVADIRGPRRHERQVDLARAFGVSRTLISRVLTGRAYGPTNSNV